MTAQIGAPFSRNPVPRSDARHTSKERGYRDADDCEPGKRAG